MGKANANAQKLFEPAEKGTIPTLKQMKWKTKNIPDLLIVTIYKHNSA